MSRARTILFGILFSIVLAVLFGAAGFKASSTEAQSVIPPCPNGTKLYGWLWSMNTGSVSMNSGNPTGGGGPHCVAIDGSNNVIGWAWSSNLGWIKFGGLSGFPAGGSTAGNAQISGGNLIGWARACGATVKSGDSASNPVFAGDCSTMTTRPGGWDGWIELTGSTATTSHSVVYNSAAGTLTGYAWGSENIGWLSFNVTSTPATTTATSCSLSSSTIATSPTRITRLSWASEGMANCRGVNFPQPPSLSGYVDVSPSVSTTYSLWCTPAAGGAEVSCPSPVDVPVSITPPAIQMWLNNDPAEALSEVRLRLGSAALVNWKENGEAEYAFCDATIGGILLGEDDGFDIVPDTSTPYVIPKKYVNSPGIYNFAMSCSEPTGELIQGKTTSGSTQLKIQIIDPTLEEI
jgi:hypothetical protein